MSANGRPSIERCGYTAVVLATLAPPIGQCLARLVTAGEGSAVDMVGVVAGSILTALAAAALLCGAPKPDPRVAGAAAAGVATPLGFAYGGLAVGASLGIVGLLSAAFGAWLLRELPAELDGAARRHRGLAVFVGLISVAAALSIARLSVFMGDAARGEYSLLPSDDFVLHHSCLSAYVEGDRLAAAGTPNLYAAEHWPHLAGGQEADEAATAYAPFALDTYAYPPPFLLLVRLSLTPLPDFASQRAVWFTLTVLAGALAVWVMARWLGGPAGLMSLLLAPLLCLNLATLVTLQTGNAHILVVVTTLMALVAFERRRPVWGGVLLAVATISKVSPGLFILVLLLQRRLRDAAWTVAACAGFGVAGLFMFGLPPHLAFVTYELPRLASGEALAFMAEPESVPLNLAPFGVPFKLAALGVPIADPWRLGAIFGRIGTVGLLLLALAALRKPRHARAQVELWGALLMLSAMSSPFAPGYIMLSLYWALYLCAVEVRGPRAAVGGALLWVTLTLPMPPGSLTAGLIALGQEAILWGTAVWLILRQTPAPSPTAPQTDTSGTMPQTWT